MRVAISTWEGKISPVFDVAKSLLVVDIEDGIEVNRSQKPLLEMTISRRASYLEQLGIDVLVCGAVSSALEERLRESGVKLIPFTCGIVEQVLNILVSGQFKERSFLMPGCRARDLSREHSVKLSKTD